MFICVYLWFLNSSVVLKKIPGGVKTVGDLRFQLKKTQDSDLLNWGEGYTEPVVAVPVARVVAAPVR